MWNNIDIKVHGSPVIDYLYYLVHIFFLTLSYFVDEVSDDVALMPLGAQHDSYGTNYWQSLYLLIMWLHMG